MVRRGAIKRLVKTYRIRLRAIELDAGAVWPEGRRGHELRRFVARFLGFERK